ncbi:MAG: histidinol-phosphate transaminase [Myxococcales bacterium]|jgi:histidinol-phosphate aminotransferase|nr:histidinol-phosphate transaminase [Myxococcales bacterium]
MCFPIPDNIESLRPYVPGKPLDETKREYGLSDVIKLASNENPLGPSPRACAAMRAAMAEVALYPDATGFELKQALAKKHGVSPQELILGCGSNELIELLIRTFVAPGDSALIADGSFIIYSLALQAAGRRAIAVPLRRDDWRYDLPTMARALDDTARLCFIANPDNPSGAIVTRAELTDFLEHVKERFPKLLVVMDEAYVDFVDAPDYPDSLALRAAHPNLVVLRTFSKSLGLAGLRVGYGILDARLANYLERVRMPFNVSNLAQAAALAALTDSEHLAATQALNRAEKAFVLDGLAKLDVDVIPPQGNFVLIDTHRPSAPIFEAMLRRGIILRPLLNYGMPTCLRISFGLREQNRQMLAALEEVLVGTPRSA